MDLEFNPGPVGMQAVPFEWTRPAREWLPADLLAEALQANERADAAPAGTPIMRLWPREFYPTKYGIQAEAVGPCPFCNLNHQHGISADPVRRLNRCEFFRPSDSAKSNRPEEVLVRFEIDEPMPEDLAFELQVWRPDLLALADVAHRHIQHRFLKRLHRRKRVTGAKFQGPGPWTRQHTHLACRRMLDAHIFDASTARMVANGMDGLEAERTCVARFIAAREGRNGIERMHSALLHAYRQAGRGSMDE